MKSILIVDIPDDYDEYGGGDWYIAGEYLSIGYKDKYGWFDGWKLLENGMMALKPMPQELPTPYMMRQIQIAEGIQTEKPPYTEEYQKGYNDCISEILGEIE